MEQFIAKSPHSIKALNALRVAANLPVNILVTGEDGTGKRALIQTVFPSIKILHPSNALEEAARGEDIAIHSLDRIQDPKRVLDALKERRLIATAREVQPLYEDYFPVIVHLSPLKERPEDGALLKERFAHQIREEFGLDIKDEDFSIDLSSNKALKKSILLHALMDSLQESELSILLERHLEKRLEEGYKNLLYLFDKPFFKAAKKRYKSVLAISKAIKLNRATVQGKMKRCGLLHDKR